MLDSLDDDFLARLAGAQPTLSPKMVRLAGLLAGNYVPERLQALEDAAEQAGTYVGGGRRDIPCHSY